MSQKVDFEPLSVMGLVERQPWMKCCRVEFQFETPEGVRSHELVGDDAAFYLSRLHRAAVQSSYLPGGFGKTPLFSVAMLPASAGHSTTFFVANQHLTTEPIFSPRMLAERLLIYEQFGNVQSFDEAQRIALVNIDAVITRVDTDCYRRLQMTWFVIVNGEWVETDTPV